MENCYVMCYDVNELSTLPQAQSFGILKIVNFLLHKPNSLDNDIIP